MSFKRLDPEDFLISADSITAGAWAGNIPTLQNFNTSSVQKSSTSGNYYLNVYQTGSTQASAEVQFNIAFGDSAGSGSVLYDSGIDGKSYTSTIYGQFQNIVLGDENNNFTFGGVTPTTQSFYALTINRAKYKGNLLPGTLDLRISGSNEIVLTDNSNDISTISYNEAGRIYQIVSGSAGSAVGASVTPANAVANGMTMSGSYGLFLPDIGTILLNASALDLGSDSGGAGLSTSYISNAAVDNNTVLYSAMSASSYFTLNSQENITSDYVFVRARNSEYNYSENPSFISGSTGEVLYNAFINAPQTFITSVGLYNDNNELLAVAKLSKPLKKDFTKEALVRVKLDF
jgi:hypothetical protein